MPARTRARLSAQPREGVHRKSALKALRRGGQVPALIYGHGDPAPIQLSARALSEYLRHHAPGALMDLEIGGTTTTALIRELDRDGVTGAVVHLGFQRVDLRETIRASIPLVFHGEQAVTAEGLVLERQLSELEVHARADLLPESITVEVGNAAAGDTIRLGDLDLPEGIEPTRDADTVIARVTEPRVAPEVEAEEAAQAAIHAGAEAGEDASEEAGVA